MRKLLSIALAAFIASPIAAQPVAPAVMPVPLVGSGAGLQTDQTTAPASSRVSVVGPVSFFGMTVTLNAGEGPYNVLLFDSTTIPPDGPVMPMRCIYVDAGRRTTTFGASTAPIGFVNGIAWAVSSDPSCYVKTSATANYVGVSFKQQKGNR